MKSVLFRLLFFILSFSGFTSQYAVPWLHSCPVLNPTEQFSSKTKLTEHCKKKSSSLESEESGHSHSLCPVCQGYLHFCSMEAPNPPLLVSVRTITETAESLFSSFFSSFISYSFSARAPPQNNPSLI